MVHFEIFCKDGCKYCRHAIALLNEICRANPNSTTFVIHDNPQQDVVDDFKRKYNHHTYPFVFADDKFVGGYSELQQLQISGSGSGSDSGSDF